jgi:hypothetical protein
MLAEAIRKNPGELHLLLQGSKVLLREERKGVRRSKAETEKAMMRALADLEAQLLPEEERLTRDGAAAEW